MRWRRFFPLVVADLALGEDHSAAGLGDAARADQRPTVSGDGAQVIDLDLDGRAAGAHLKGRVGSAAKSRIEQRATSPPWTIPIGL